MMLRGLFVGLLCRGAAGVQFLGPENQSTVGLSESTVRAEKLKQLGDNLEAQPPITVTQQNFVRHEQVPIGSQAMGSGSVAGPAPSTVFAPNLRERIYEDSKRLGSAAESLLAIQADINRVQTEVQGKVFDLETVRGFFATHQYLTAEAEQCKEQLSRKDELLANMGNELHEAEMTYQNATSAMAKRMEEMQAKTATASQEEKTIEAEYLGSRKSILEDEKIRAENKELVSKLERASDLAVQNTRDRKTIDELEKADQAHKELVNQLQSSVKALQEQVTTLQESDRQKDVQLVDHVEELKKAAKVSQDQAKIHVATAEHDKEEMKKQVATLLDEKSKLEEENKKLKEGIASVQYQAVRKFESMKATIGKYKDHINSLRESVSQNIVARKKEEGEVNRLTQLLLKSDAETIKQQLDNTQKELAEAHDQLKETRVAKAKAEADLVAEASARAASEKIAANEKVAAEKARQETIDRVAQCEQQKAEELAVANANFQKCQTKINELGEEKCGERWRELNKESLLKIEKCKVTEETLRTCTAEKEVLRSAASGALCGGEAAPGGAPAPAGEAATADETAAEEGEAAAE